LAWALNFSFLNRLRCSITRHGKCISGCSMSEFEWTIRYVIYTNDQLYDQLYFFLSDTFRCTIFNIEKYFLLLSPFPWNVSFHCPLENCILQRHLWSKFRPQSLANWSVALRRARDLHLNCFWPAPSSATCNRILRESPCLFALAPRRFWTRKKIVYNKHSIHT